MSKVGRKKEQALETNELEQMILDYYTLNTTKNDIEKKLKPLNSKIKEMMEIGTLQVGCVIATKSIQERTSINEDKLFDILDTLQYRDMGLIKTKEFVDMDLLEKLVGEEKIDANLLIPAQKVNEVVTLRVSEAKGGK